MPLHRRRAVVREEVVAVHEKFPRRFVAGVGQVELPRNVAVLLPSMHVTGKPAGLVGERVLLHDIALLVRLLAHGHREEKVALQLIENPDILKSIGAKKKDRPRLVIGFAAETNDVEKNAKAKLAKKGCDWVVANDVSGDVMGGADNEILLVTKAGVERWPRMAKAEVAMKLAERIAENFYDPETSAAE